MQDQCIPTLQMLKTVNSDPALQTPNMVHWYIHKHTYAYMTTVICAHKQILSSLEALPIVRLGGVSRQKSQYFQLI